MAVITIAGQKGGSGKSNLVRNLAVHFALDGYRVGLVDADLIQQHSSDFFANREGSGNQVTWRERTDLPGIAVGVWDRTAFTIPDGNLIVAPQVDQDTIGDVIQALAERLDVVLCDLQGSASVAMIHAIHYADLVLIPVQPSNDDLRSAHSTARHVVHAAKSSRREIPYRLVISRASTGFRPEVEKVVEAALEKAHIPRLQTLIFERTAFKKATFSRIPPAIDDPAGNAAANTAALYREVLKLVGDLAAQTRQVS